MKRKFELKSKRNFVLLFSAVAAALFALIFLLFCWQNERASVKSAYAALGEYVAHQTSELDSIYEGFFDSLKIIAESFALEEKRALLAEDAANASPEASGAGNAGSGSGATALAGSGDEGNAARQKLLARFQERSPFTRLFYAEPSGRAVNNLGESFDISGENFFRQAKGGAAAIQADLFSPLAESPTVVLAVPLYDGRQGFAGALGASCSPSYANELFALPFGGQSFSYIVDQENRLIAKPPELNVSQQERDLAYALWKDGGEKHKYSYNGALYYFCTKRLQTNGWQLVTVVPASVIRSRDYGARWWALALMFVTLAAFVLLALAVFALQERNAAEASRRANTDSVTGGVALQKFMADADAFIAEHADSPLTAYCFDINDFSAINDIYGFGEGSKILAMVHKTAKAHLGKHGILARVANDIFYVLRKDISSRPKLVFNMQSFADSLNKLLVENQKRYRVSFAFGVYQLEEGVTSASVAFERASRVHSVAKAENAPYVFYHESFRKEAIQRKLIENSMREAFDNMEFRMFLQPKYELVTKQLVGAEALIRWKSGDSSRKSPKEFIPVFEKTGFIAQIDLFMVESACQTLRKWIDSGVPPVPISVNQSKVLLLNPFYFNVVTATIEKYNIPPRLIEIEIAENIMYGNTAELSALISRIHDYNMRVSIDNFGSGYSSMALLRDIHADILKIDRAFICKAEQDATDKKILSAVIQLADALNMQILASGIETEEQAQMLHYLGCHEAQGFLYGRPVEAEEFLLVNGRR